MTDILKLAVLVSGSGSNLQAIIDRIESGALAARISVVISNNRQAYALERAAQHGIPTCVLSHRDFATRELYDENLVAAILAHQVDLVVLAGFMRVLSPVFIRSFPGRIINIHPALLPSFPGVHAQRQALDYGVKFTGCTVHFVDEGVDTGPIIIQAVVPVFDEDTESSLAERILSQEHRILPEAIRLFAAGQLAVHARGVKILSENRPAISSLSNPPCPEN
jgi:phosphoribosylglycinamide formyltransferase-1